MDKGLEVQLCQGVRVKGVQEHKRCKSTRAQGCEGATGKGVRGTRGEGCKGSKV